MFIQTEETPNPNAIKFIPGMAISPNESVHYFQKDQCENSPLATKLFEISGVKGVFFGSDFITITKEEVSEWDFLKPEVLMTIMDHFASGLPVFENEQSMGQARQRQDLSDIEQQIVDIIENKVRPAVATDGGDIIYQSFNQGVVKLALHGSCSGCPSSTITLKNGIENMLKHYIPEVESVEAVNM